RDQNAAALWKVLSTPTRRELGPTLADFRKKGWPEFEETFGYFASHRWKLVVSERIVGPFGAVAIASGCCHAYAFPMRREHGTWTAALTTGRLPIGVLLAAREPLLVARNDSVSVRRRCPAPWTGNGDRSAGRTSP